MALFRCKNGLSPKRKKFIFKAKKNLADAGTSVLKIELDKKYVQKPRVLY